MGDPGEEVSQRVREAFLGLLAEKPYARITFKELAAASGMSRQNLYYYYKTKEAVLEDVIEDFFDSIHDTMMRYSPAKVAPGQQEELAKALIRETLKAIKEREQVAGLLFADDIAGLAIDKQIAFLKRVLGGLIRARDIKVNDPKFIHYLALQISGASYQVVREWLLVDTDFPIERMVELGHPMVLQVIRSLENN